jgi:ABC-type polysaccharide transport system permease subunit
MYPPLVFLYFVFLSSARLLAYTTHLRRRELKKTMGVALFDPFCVVLFIIIYIVFSFFSLGGGLFVTDQSTVQTTVTRDSV